MPRTPLRAVALVLSAGLGLIAGLGCERQYTDADIRYSSLEEVRRMSERDRSNDDHLLLIDPRPARKFREAHLPGAANIELAQIRDDAEQDPAIARHDNLVVYGDNPGDSSARAMTLRLMRAGYDDVRLFAGGVDEWRTRGLPLEGEPAAADEPAARP